MSNESQIELRQLPEQPNLRHLRDQAKDLFKAGQASSLADAQFKIARSYGFASWPRLRAQVQFLGEAAQLWHSINAEDFVQAKALLTKNPNLHRAPLGYAGNGTLTWVAECRFPRRPPTRARLEMAAWLIEHGSDVHQGGDGPLMRAALDRDRVAMMELLVSYGADVNAEWNGDYPIIFAACEAVDPVTLKWLLDHGANPNCANASGRVTAMEYAIGSYARSSQLGECIDLIREAGGTTRYDLPGVLDILTGRLDRLGKQLDENPQLVNRRYPGLDFGSSGGRRLLLDGATLLHIAAEYHELEAAQMLLDRGADVNGRATVDEVGIGGQTPVFHAVSQFNDGGLEVARLLVERGADLTVRAKLPGHYEVPDEIVECTPLGYALRFPGGESETVAFLRALNAPE